MSKESEFLERLRDTFKGESEEHRGAILAGLLELEKGNSGSERDKALIENLFRDAHSLKGAARAVDIREIEQLCQYLEDIFSAIKKGNRRPSLEMYDTMYRSLDLITQFTKGQPSVSEEEMDSVLRLLQLETKAGRADTVTEKPAEAPAPAAAARNPGKKTLAAPDTVRISNTLLSSIFLGTEEMISVKQAMLKHSEDLGEILLCQETWNASWSKLDGTIDRLQKQAVDDKHLKRLLDFIALHTGHARKITEKLAGLSAVAARDSLHTEERINYLQGEIKTALMLPASSLLESFSMMVRDLAREEGKEVVWDVHGDDTLIDRRVLDKIKDPLIHIVRNCISHGIEKADFRVGKGKPRTGTVRVDIERTENDNVEITVSDDGAGVDIAAVKKIAVEKKLIPELSAASLVDAEALELIFLSELSTSPAVTAISGRGLGLAIARENIASIGGMLTVGMKEGRGTVFHIRIPVSLATFRGVLVRDSGQSFVIPTRNIDRVLRVERSGIALVDNRETILIDKQVVPLVNLSEILALQRGKYGTQSGENSFVVVLLVTGIRIALRVDGVTGEQEVLARTLGKNLARVRNISGTTVLPTGELVPILNPFDLLKSVMLTTGSQMTKTDSGQKEKTAKKILVVDDSVTSRTLLKGLLESSGYEVTTAVDGVEAFSVLRLDTFDILISDIEMPRMNGFDLCKKVRSLPSTAELPLILITSLNSREDRERGIDAGANAYIAKSGFDQKNLLDVVKRLL